MTATELASQVRTGDGPAILASVIGDGPGASQAQDAVALALVMVIGQGQHGPGADQPAAFASGSSVGVAVGTPAAQAGTPAYTAAKRFAGLPASARHAWLVHHLSALRAGQVTLAQLP
jgi:hypothetical protein